MTYPYSTTYSISTNDITMNAEPCLSVDINGHLFISSGGFVFHGNILNYYGYNVNDNIWKTFSDSSYWIKYNYDMRTMACIVHNQVLYTFGGAAGGTDYLTGYYGSNMISYHDISDYNKPFLLNGYSLWNKISQNLNPTGGCWRVVSVNELIYIIGGYSYTTKLWINDVQVFDPNTQRIKGKLDGVIPLLNGLSSTTCHFRSTTNAINCFGGMTAIGVTNQWIYSNPLSTDVITNSPAIPIFTYTPTHIPSYLASNSSSNDKNSLKNVLSTQLILTIVFSSILLITIIIGFICNLKCNQVLPQQPLIQNDPGIS